MVRCGRQWNLPKPEGPYVPGIFDITTVASDAHPAQLVRLYYPTDLPASEDHSSKWVEWILHPKYIEGMGSLVGIWGWVVKFVFWLLAGRAMIPAVWAAPPSRRKMPVIIVSHGLGANRVLYTTTVVQLASQGFLVACLEHGDRSACATYRRLPREQWISYQPMSKDTSQHSAMREAQIEHRVKDCLATLHLLDGLNAGSVSTSIELTGLLDFSSLTLMGHSFGAATTLTVLGQESRFKLGIILDAWMYPINKYKETLPDSIHQPLIFINTETFHIDKNIRALRSYVKHHPVYTMRGTTHEHQTDTPHLLGSWLNLRMKNKMDYALATKINNYLIMRWLKQHTNQPLTFDPTFLDSQSESIVLDLMLANT